MLENKVTVFITTYNRANEVKRAIASLEKQTCKYFKCIVVDDGSVDNTREVITQLSELVSFPLAYYYQENAGALNARYTALQKIDTEFCISLDSDDELMPDTVETFLKSWEALSDLEKKKYDYGIIGLVKSSADESIFGGKWPDKINEFAQKKYIKWLVKGERYDMARTEIFKEKYKEHQKLLALYGESFLPERILNYKYDMCHRYYAVNHVVRIYHVESGESLIRSPLNLKKCRQSYICYSHMLKNYFPTKQLPFILNFQSCIYVIRFGMNLKKSVKEIWKDMGKTSNKILGFAAIPFGIGNYLLGRKPVNEKE